VNNNKLTRKSQSRIPVGSSAVLASMVELVERWRKRAAKKFKDAETEKDAMGKRLIEHGAMCYFNCSQELQEIVAALRASATPSESEKTMKHLA